MVVLLGLVSGHECTVGRLSAAGCRVPPLACSGYHHDNDDVMNVVSHSRALSGLVTALFTLGLAVVSSTPVHGQARPAPKKQPQREAGPDPGPYAQWKVRVGGGAGITSNFDTTYFTLNLGAGVFVLDGLEVGAGVEQWLGSGPFVTKLAPQVRYVLWFVPVLTPYIGTFYRHWFISDGIEDIDTVGGRAGVFMARGPAVFGGGVVVEHAFAGCDGDCLFVYPELVLSFSF